MYYKKCSIPLIIAVVVSVSLLTAGCGGDKGVNLGDGSISGRVYKVGSSRSIFGVRVSCAGVSTTTSTNGYYELHNLPTGSQTLTAYKPDYEPFSASVNITQGTEKDIYIKSAKEVKEGEIGE